MKVFRVCPAPFHLQSFRSENGLDDKTFDEQIRLLQQENLLLPGGWAAAVRDQGFEVEETLYNDFALQAQWCREQSPRTLSLVHIYMDMYFEVFKAQILSFQPDVLFIYAGALLFLPADYRRALRLLLRKRLIITGYWGDELPQGNNYKSFFQDIDFIFCSSAGYKRKFDEVGIPAMVNGNCFDDTIAHKPSSEKQYDFTFSGTTGFGFPDHIDRYEKLTTIMALSDLRVWANEPDAPKPRPPLADVKNIRAGSADLLVFARKIVRRLRGRRSSGEGESAGKTTELAPKHTIDYFAAKRPLKALFPDRVQSLLLNSSDYYRLVQRSKLVLNIHRDEDADVGNIRCFEVTGLGSCLVTDRGTALSEFFDTANDMVTFATAEECLQKVHYLLANPLEIDRIAQNGRNTTLTQHTVKHRAMVFAAKMRRLAEGSSALRPVASAPLTVEAIYEPQKYPSPHTFGAFLQAAEIFRTVKQADRLTVAAGGSSFAGAPKHIGKLLELMPKQPVAVTRQDVAAPRSIAFPGADVANDYSAFYRLINANPDIVCGFQASATALNDVARWRTSIRSAAKMICLHVKHFAADPLRNSNLAAFAEFASKLNPEEFSVVIVLDTDSGGAVANEIFEKFPTRELDTIDIDTFFALCESAHVNIFTNSDTALLATLGKRLRYLMFKIAPASHHVAPQYSPEYFQHLGFTVGDSPRYATEFQKWVWAEERSDILWHEFTLMNELMQDRIQRHLGATDAE